MQLIEKYPKESDSSKKKNEYAIQLIKYLLVTRNNAAASRSIPDTEGQAFQSKMLATEDKDIYT